MEQDYVRIPAEKYRELIRAWLVLEYIKGYFDGIFKEVDSFTKEHWEFFRERLTIKEDK